MSGETSSRPTQARVHKDTSARPVGSRSWIALKEASRRLGVSATTLRRWADAGSVRTFVTPGGHRRFDVASVRALLPGSPGRPTMEQLGETPERMSRAYRRVGTQQSIEWLSALDDRQRTVFREHGQGIARDLLAALDASTEADRAAHIEVASALAGEYGVAAAKRGLGVATTVETFLQFRRPFINELLGLAQRRGLEATATREVIARAADAIDQLLVATVRAYESTTPAMSHTTPR